MELLPHDVSIPVDSLAYDRQIRALLKAHLSTRVGEGDLVVDEFGLAFGDVRADVAIVNGALEGFEIKAGRDTLTRLPTQVAAYSKVFEFAWVVTTTAHLAKVLASVPQWWGLLVAKSDAQGAVLVELRPATRNRERDADHLVRLLWRDELLARLDAMGLSKGVRTKPKLVLYGALARALSVEQLGEYVLQCLKARSAWRVETTRLTGGGSSRRIATS